MGILRKALRRAIGEAGAIMKFNTAIVRAIMQAQFDDLKRKKGTQAATAEEHYPFGPQDVDEVFFPRPGEGRSPRFRLKDGRGLDVRGVPVESGGMDGDDEPTVLAPALQEMIDSWDVMDRLPLTLVPLSSTTLRGARLIKTAKLETMVELHTDRTSGSLQVKPDHIHEAFPRFPDDQKLIRRLSDLHSYDVYSLRMNLRRMGIAVDDGALELSETMKTRLDKYTPEFTLPLVRAIFGNDGAHIGDRQGLIRMFRDPDRARVAEKLKQISRKTGIAVENIPAFLERYADVFLSVAYYQHNFEAITPQLTRCGLWLREASAAARHSPHGKRVEDALGFLITTVRERLRLFRTSFSSFWTEMNAAAFERLKDEIEGRYIGTGAMLCGLGVKMRHWSRTFHDSGAGGPATRLQYLASEMEPGLIKLCEFGAKA